MKKIACLLLLTILFLSAEKKKIIIVWQPSHQTDTGKDFSEAATCNAIVEAAMETKPHFREYKELGASC